MPEALQDRFKDTPNGIEYILVHQEDAGKDESITLTQSDIRQIQLAKGAIFSGIAMLQKVMEISDDDLQELLMCGGFGNYINVENAVKIRLVPNLPVERITYAGNAALMGAEIALLSEEDRLRAADLAHSIEHVGLATHPDFQDIFVDAMSFLDNGNQNADDTPCKPRRAGGRRAAVGGA